MIYINATNSFQTRVRTGIQRVVRELGKRLSVDPDYRLVAIHGESFYVLQDDDEIAAFMAGESFTPRHRIDLDAIRAGDVFFDVDASWGDPCQVAALWRRLKRQGCILAKLHHDAVPLLYPHFSHETTAYRYLENFAAAVRYMDYWICNSRTVERDLHRIVRETGLGDVQTFVCQFGADISTTGQPQPPARFAQGAPERYIICVGTIEPRKNHELVLDVFEALIQTPEFADVHLVLVGKSGWNNQRVVERITQHAEADRRLHWVAGIPDAELEWLYQRAAVCLCLSHYEGFGLPVIEALSRGVPVICTRDSAMDEVGAGAVITVPLDRDAVVTALEDFFSAGGKAVPADYRVPSWDAAAQSLRTIFADILDARALDAPPRQVVYISIRPDSLRQSLLSMQQYLPFIDEAVILTSDAQMDAMREATQALRIRTTLLGEREIGLDVLPADHQERNTLLRHRLYAHGAVEENFIACDDDCRAIQSVDLAVFMEAGRHKAHYFYEDGREWLGAFPTPTSFDEGIWKTTDFLRASGFDTRLYNAHQPQIINKRLALAVFERTQGLGCDEWSSYFNMAKHLRPGRFEDVVYRAGGWPGQGASWLPSHPPADMLFFNDPPDDVDASVAAQAWLSQLDAAMANTRSLRPGLPHLVVESGRVRFTESELACPAGYELCIPILADCRIDRIRYEFLNHSIELTGHLPNLLHVPVPADTAGQSFPVQAVVELSGATQIAVLAVRVDDAS